MLFSNHYVTISLVFILFFFLLELVPRTFHIRNCEKNIYMKIVISLYFLENHLPKTNLAKEKIKGMFGE
jgi:CBS domain containing-hemolysin-like protein